MAATAGQAVMLDPDTFTSPDSYDIARLAAGATVQAAEHAVAQREPAFALVRPPGHHAEPDRAMGFCMFNNVAVAAAAMLARGLERIAIVDIDVHHGNGTQTMFYDEPRVLYISTHQFPFYPGTGAAEEIGDGCRAWLHGEPAVGGRIDRRGLRARPSRHRWACARPVPSGAGARVSRLRRARTRPAGVDAYDDRGYARLSRQLRDVAARHGALALVTEGGYELTALASCLEASIAVLDGGAPPTIAWVIAKRGAGAVARRARS